MTNETKQHNLRIFRDAVAEYGAGLPAEMVNQVMEYVFDRREPSDFLRGVIANDLDLAVTHIGGETRTAHARLRAWLKFVQAAVPMAAQGSREAYTAWIDGDPSSLSEGEGPGERLS